MGLDTKTYRLTDRQSQCDFDFDRRPGKEHQCNQWSETRTTGPVIVMTVTVTVKVSANKTNIF
jgi:hypothetical protein